MRPEARFPIGYPSALAGSPLVLIAASMPQEVRGNKAKLFRFETSQPIRRLQQPTRPAISCCHTLGRKTRTI